MCKLTHSAVPSDEAASCVLLFEDCSTPLTSALFWLAARNPTDAEFQSTDKTHSFALAPPSRQHVYEVGLESHQTRYDEAAVQGRSRAWGTHWLARGAVPASWRILNSALPRAETEPVRQGEVSSVRLEYSQLPKYMYRYRMQKHSSAHCSSSEKLRKSASCFWRVSQTTWVQILWTLGDC